MIFRVVVGVSFIALLFLAVLCGYVLTGGDPFYAFSFGSVGHTVITWGWQFPKAALATTLGMIAVCLIYAFKESADERRVRRASTRTSTGPPFHKRKDWSN